MKIMNNLFQSKLSIIADITLLFKQEDEDNDNRRGGKQQQVSPITNLFNRFIQSMTYNAEKIIGNGSFGVVFKATIAETGETVAIKKVFQDKRYKNRELTILKMLHHPNCVEMRQSFYTNGDKPEEVYLNVVMDYIPDTAYRVMK